MHPEIIVSRAAHSDSEEVAESFVSKAAYDALAARLAAAEEAYDRVEYAFDLHMDIIECRQAMSEYASIVYDMAMIALAEQNTALQAQLGQAHEALLLAQADLEAVLTELRTYFTARTQGERGDARVQLKVLAREAHPGTALADEVRAARAREAGLQLAADQYSESRDQWMLKAKSTQAELAAARPLVEEARSIVNADCDCCQRVRIGALLAAYDATQGGEK
jgi:hypothetical protein